jgi:hypothetical protein
MWMLQELKGDVIHPSKAKHSEKIRIIKL